ncbi:MAG: DUF2403 domain-containing protein [Deltaproteobacteria bacterium]|nr:DUF2403 domain-containing protein [Deltaproteobacteria bacterium]
MKTHILFLPIDRLWWVVFFGIGWLVAVLPACSENDHAKDSLSDTGSSTADDDTGSTVPDVPTGTQGGNWSDLDGRAAPTHTSPAAENSGTVTLGGTITFTNIGAPGYWGRRIEAEPGDDRCDVQSETLNYSWGGSEFCCRTTHNVTSDRLTPFNEQLAMVIEGPLKVKQFAVYQPLEEGGSWGLRSYWDRDSTDPFNIHFVGPGDTTDFDGILGNNCAFHAMQEKPFSCGPDSVPYCPGSGLDYEGWAGSKLFLLLAAMPYTQDPELLPKSCIADGEDEREQDAPWIGLGASELIRDGWAGYHPCHCFANTNGALGDGCGQINVFEVIAETSGAEWGNRDVISTGIRSYQVGSLGGSTCGIQGCSVDLFADDADLVDANHVTAMTTGAVIDADNRAMAEGPMWRRALDDRYYLILLDEATRTVQVAVIHPDNVPDELTSLLPALPNELSRPFVDGLVQLRLPKGV